jgi:hypothetical protein
MPLRDHFQGQIGKERRWESFLTTWVVTSGQRLTLRLAPGYFAEPKVTEETGGNGVATAVWAPPKPTVSVVTDLPE